MDCPHESLKANTETALEALIALSEHDAYWRRKDAIDDEQYAKALRSRK